MTLRHCLIVLALLFTPALAFAHPGHPDAGLLAGISHPLGGLDHLLAMLAVGLWAAQQTGNARWALPLTFMGSMLLGGLLGFAGISLPFAETAIAGSVLALSLLVVVAARLPLLIATSLTAVFALCHGGAHGLELPALSNAWSYACGFLLATGSLHALGYALIRYLPQAAVRLGAVGSAGAGVWLLVG